MSRPTSRSPLERFLSLFAEVHSGEGGKTLLLALDVFLLLTAYYIIKPVRESLILSDFGAEVKSYASAGQVVLLAVLIPIYSRLVDRYERGRLITVVTLFFMACMVGFYFLLVAGVGIGIVFFLWVGIFNMMIIAQFWSFANDLYSVEAGKRVFAIIAFGASAGAVAGSKITSMLISLIGIPQLLLVSCALLGATIVLAWTVDRRERRVTSASTGADGDVNPSPGPPGEEEDSPSGGGFALVLRSRYLLMIALLMLFSNWVNTTGEYLLGRLVDGAATAAVLAGTANGLSEGEWIGKFYSDFFLVVNIVSVLTQLFLVSRILKYFGVRVALLILPLTSLFGNGLLLIYPALSIIRWTKTAENATDYSLQNTVRHVLFLPLSREEKYSAKQAIDSFFVRVGDVLSAALVYLGTTRWQLGIEGFAGVNLVLIVGWLVLAWGIGRENRRLVAARGGELAPDRALS